MLLEMEFACDNTIELCFCFALNKLTEHTFHFIVWSGKVMDAPHRTMMILLRFCPYFLSLSTQRDWTNTVSFDEMRFFYFHYCHWESVWIVVLYTSSSIYYFLFDFLFFCWEIIQFGVQLNNKVDTRKKIIIIRSRKNTLTICLSLLLLPFGIPFRDEVYLLVTIVQCLR